MVEPGAPNVQRNRLLNSLSNADLALLQPHLRAEPLKFRQRIQSANRNIKTVYFPESGLGSVVAIGNGDRRQAEVAVIGREGTTGVPVVNGADRSPCEVFMQVEGEGQAIATENLKDAMRESASLLQCFLRFSHVLAVQGSYTALANSQIEERLARWLLMAHDRLETNELLLTHDFLALMLGVRRAGVTAALGEFDDRRLVRTSRGAITIVDRDGLEECANGLYGTPEAEYERLFGAA